jgi:BirA family biotin operon repressor/biotin-[acetyl-CoA-carboxylase] ligase
MKPDLKNINILKFDALSSTNALAEEMLASGHPPEGTMIVADTQTDGKGAGNNTWESETGKNLLATIILYPDFLPAEKQFLLNKCISLAVLNCIKYFAHDSDVKIKWPNDIYVGNKKIGGILIKNTISGQELQNCIVGIGLNINQENFNKSLPNPVSLKQIIGCETSINELLAVLYGFIEKEYVRLADGKSDHLDSEYLRNMLFYDQTARFNADRFAFEGVICGVSEFGKLQVKVEGKIREFDLKEIEFLFE